MTHPNVISITRWKAVSSAAPGGAPTSTMTAVIGANLKGATFSRSILRGANLAGANLAGANLKRRDLAGERHRLVAGLRRRRHAAQREVDRDPIDAETGRQLPHRVAHTKRGVARPQHRRAEAQHDVERFGESGWLFRRPRR